MKKILYILTILFIFSFFTLTVNAADLKFTASLQASENEINKGNDVSVTVSVSDFNDAKKGINTFSCTLEYDTSSFEDITKDDIKGLNDWVVDYNESNGKLKLTKLKYATSKQDVAQITLKVKSDTSSSNATVELTDLIASNSDSELVAENVSTSFTISESSSNSQLSNNSTPRNLSTNTVNRVTNNSTPRIITSNQNTNNNLNTNTNNSISNYSNESNEANESENDEIPHTGLDDSIVKAIILIALVGAFGYIKFKSIDKK